ncbi:MAG: sister chromatid cohesion protein 1 [Chrysothrix sp. TS-e1954]|nr:MAG: sister chromatid cohesion protein 1 [Chrysothrix sp. TS-e1954]
MFYSETLLSKTGPLAHVWLAANIERKLSKSQIVQSSVEKSVEAIVNEGQAPLALRLSGQLLLGVARIYRKKARYLLDDCNEAILKIKMAFRSGNVDLPANQMNMANPASLTLPDRITEIDLLGPPLDPSLLLLQGIDDNSLFDIGNSQLTVEVGRAASEQSEIEIGRRAPAPQNMEEDFDETTKLYDEDLGLDIGPEPTFGGDSSMFPGIGAETRISDGDLTLGGLDADDGFRAGEDDQLELPPPESEIRDPSLALDVRPSAEREAEDSFQDLGTPVVERQDESVHQAQQRVKRRKILEIDSDTQIPSRQIREQQNDRSKILKPRSLLPQDPVLQALIELQKNGGFVSSILGDGRSKGWAPELRGILSLEVIQGSTNLKRKRDASHTRDVSVGLQSQQDVQEPANALEVETRSMSDGHLVNGDNTVLEGAMTDANDADGLGLPDGDETLHIQSRAGTQEPRDQFDHTEMPLLHPADSGPVSVGTKHVVHMLREKFGPGAAKSPSKRQDSSVLFQDLLPERTTTKADATKMFFEVLVLATKDAVKVSQDEDQLGGPLQVRGKRGLWGGWAELEAGGEIDQQGETIAV